MKRFNMEHLLNCILLLSLIVALFYLISTGNINNLLHPRMQRLTLISAALLIILMINEFFRTFSIVEKKSLSIKRYLIFFATIIIGMFASAGGLHVHENTNKTINLNFTEINTNIKENEHESVNAEAINGGNIIIDGKNYLYMMTKINEERDMYKGKNVLLEGFVFKDESIKKNEFVTARFVMKSSAIDTEMVGMLCKWKDSSNFKINDWVRVEGIIDYKETSKGYITILNVKRANKVDKPINSYIY